MSNNKIFMKTAILVGLIFASSTVFAVKLVPGVSDTCEQLWLVNDVDNAGADANFGGGECIDVPVNLKKVKVLFNLDNAVTQTKPTAATAGALGRTKLTL